MRTIRVIFAMVPAGLCFALYAQPGKTDSENKTKQMINYQLKSQII